MLWVYGHFKYFDFRRHIMIYWYEYLACQGLSQYTLRRLGADTLLKESQSDSSKLRNDGIATWNQQDA